jgi:hypothetical protein
MTSFNLDPSTNPPKGSDPAASAAGTRGGAGPTLHIDSDWKAQAQAEKERLSRMEEERASGRKGEGRRGAEELPPADFRSLVGLLASQALGGLGTYGDSKTGRVIVDLAGAKFGIDLLGVMEEKTKGNLSPEEAAELREVLAELRSRYVHFHDLLTRQQAAGLGAGEGQAAQVRPPASGPTLHMP